MNTKTPLAAALLLIASSAMAQLTLTPSPALGTGSFGDTTLRLSPTSPYNQKVPDDASFNCSTLYNMNWATYPMVFCTPAQETARTSFLGFCPLGNMACHSYMQRIMLPKDFNPAEAQGEIDASKAANAPEPAKPIEAASATGATPQPGDYNFMGPVQGPPAPDAAAEAQDKKAFEKAREQIGEDGVKDVVDLGNGNIAKMRDDGTVEMCGRSQCAKPVPADTLKNPKIEEWVANNNAGYDPNGGMKSLTNPRPGSKGTPPDNAGGSQTGSDTQSSPSDEAKGLGRQIPRDVMAASGGSGMQGAGAGGSVGGKGYAAEASAKDVVKVDKAQFEKLLGAPNAFSYPVLGAISEKAAAQITPGAFDAEPQAKKDPNAKAEKYRGIEATAQ